ncbi:hypothetical protein ACFYSH_01665 [Streptomyces sp. NPDC005791]|uniref:hypothetical protein n=1 Tax=unclassified Streptomyces TaxID=2593676 RepID=UPI0034079BF5
MTTRQLLDGVRESGLPDVVRYADEHPVLEKHTSVRADEASSCAATPRPRMITRT